MNPLEIPGIVDNERFEAEMKKRIEAYVQHGMREERNWACACVDVELVVMTNMFYKLKSRDETIMDAARVIAQVVKPPYVASYQQGTKFMLLAPAAEAQDVLQRVKDAIQTANTVLQNSSADMN